MSGTGLLSTTSGMLRWVDVEGRCAFLQRELVSDVRLLAAGGVFIGVKFAH